MNTSAKKKRIMLCFLSVLLLSGCPTDPSAIRVEGVVLDRQEIGGEAGSTLVLSATVVPADATDQSVSWSSDDASVAEVDPDTGAVTINATGIATITATTHDGAKNATCVVYGGQLGHWPLRDSLDDVSGSGFDGTWRGAPTGAGMSAGPEYVTEGGRTGVHFRYTANEAPVPDPAIGSGDWVDCEGSDGPIDNGHLHSALAVSDYITVSFWLYWDPDQHEYYDGSGLVPDPFVNEDESGEECILNIVNKCTWTDKGWQIRYERDESGYYDDVFLHIHHSSKDGNTEAGGKMELFSLFSGLSDYRGQWVHVTVVLDNVNLVFRSFVNGVQQGIETTYLSSFDSLQDYTPENSTWNSSHFAIGAFSHSWGGYSVNGKMSDVRFFHGLLDADDVARLYESDVAALP